MTSSISCAPALRKKLQTWFRRAGRDLPWRGSSDPYAVAVSEIMLQQTTVAAVLPYYKNWMARFPTVDALAEAGEAEVLGLWQGLGYYRRARNFHKAAQIVCARHQGRFPRSTEDLRSLPGFGEYTASAIQAFARDLPVPVIDANIARVLARLGNIRLPVDKAAGKAALARMAHALLPARSGGRAHTSALMDLGAMVCTPRIPRCGICPLRTFCLAREANPEDLPVKSARKPVTVLNETREFVMRGAKVGLVPSRGARWHGLWVMPPCPSTATVQDGRTPIHVEVYPITRYRVRMEVVRAGRVPQGTRFFALEELPPMPSPHARALRAVAALRRSSHSG